MKSVDMITAINLMERDASAVKRAAETIENYAAQKNCAVWIEQPDGERIALKSGCRIYSAEFVPFEKHE